MGKWRYGVVLDAGSSGTRLHVYRWHEAVIARQNAKGAQLRYLPMLETQSKWTKKIHPGVSSYRDTPDLMGPDHLWPLLQYVLKVVPRTSVRDTPIFLLATAGVRLLPDSQRAKLMKEICTYIQTSSQFLLSDCDLHVRAISGETEGLYGWIAANYLVGALDTPIQQQHGKGHHTYGFLDMGGASAQIAFVPNVTEAEKHSNDLKLLRLRSIGGQALEYRVFVTTWLGFGVNEARKRYITALTKASEGTGTTEMLDPCLPDGMKMSVEGAVLPNKTSLPDGNSYLLGTGSFDECLRATYPLLDKDAPCDDQPCLLHGVHVPAIDFDVNHFIGISEYWHTTHEVFTAANKDTSYDLGTYQQWVSNFCHQNWASVQAGVMNRKWGKKVDLQTAIEVCFRASWLINFLHEGIGVPRIGLENGSGAGRNGTTVQGQEKKFLEPFQAVDKIQDTEVSWTMGMMVLYAASQIPPLDKGDLPVGFGSNEPGIPLDFHYPARAPQSITSNTSIFEGQDESLAEHIHHTLFDSDSRRRIPGFLLFLMIIVIAAFYLCGRDRRSRLWRNVFANSGRKRRLFAAKLPFMSRANTSSYERVLEDGEQLEELDSFELQSGEAQSNHLTPGETRTPGGGMSRHILLPRLELADHEVMDRRGLAVRTESRESLALHIGRKSRTGSPQPPSRLI